MKRDATGYLCMQLDHAGWHYVREYVFARPRRWRADFFLEDRLCVEIEGIGYGRSMGRHQTAAGYVDDTEKYNEMTLRGIPLLRFVPNQIFGKQKNRAKKKLPLAIDVIDRYLLGDRFEETDRRIAGYAKRS